MERVGTAASTEILTLRYGNVAMGPEFVRGRPGEVIHSCLAISSVRKALGVEPQAALHKGVVRTFAAPRDAARAAA
ncbi:MAG: hypothetical protein JWM31_986 [Solirubrobacterales bacterium]|nr:hypothetical protein [Solirubrobacterales bacterium]